MSLRYVPATWPLVSDHLYGVTLRTNVHIVKWEVQNRKDNPKPENKSRCTKYEVENKIEVEISSRRWPAVSSVCGLILRSLLRVIAERIRGFFPHLLDFKRTSVQPILTTQNSYFATLMNMRGRSQVYYQDSSRLGHFLRSFEFRSYKSEPHQLLP